MANNPFSYFTRRPRNSTEMSKNLAAAEADMEDDPPLRGNKRSRLSTLPSERPTKIVRRLQHVAIPVRPKSVTGKSTNSLPAGSALPTPPESVAPVKPIMSSRPHRTSSRVNYVQKETSSSDDQDDGESQLQTESEGSVFEEAEDEVSEFGEGDDYCDDCERESASEGYTEDVSVDSDQVISSPAPATNSTPRQKPTTMKNTMRKVPTKERKRARAKTKTDSEADGNDEETIIGGNRRGLDLTRRPLSDINDIFHDITEKALEKGLGKALNILNGRELRVATMCSGTESPLLALQLVSESLERLGKQPLRLKHLFSAEIVPIKQAYIERNFNPPIIFRDIRELAEKHARIEGATNVYGAKVKVPGDIDLLVAGFSCVDYSNLNQQKKTAFERGESRDTLMSICAYAKTWTPRMIVLENLWGAPWNTVIKKMAEVGYLAQYTRVDTKDYYLPQTRARGYMLCIHQKQYKGDATAAIRKWTDLVEQHFKRRASAPVSAFLLPTDDPRVHHFNAELARQIRDDAKDRTVTWDACRLRHEKVRSDEGLGEKKPITEWVEGGTCVTFEHAHKQWLLKQVERVWDSIDIRYLRAAKEKGGFRGFDPSFKTMVMELSQNVDRGGETAFGICSCITPSGIFYITDRAAPLTPHETLALQGIPLDKITFTVEKAQQVQDLAGNAMSSTVIGVAQLAALIVAGSMLEHSSGSSKEHFNSLNVDANLRGEDELGLVLHKDMSWPENMDFTQLCADARKSCRRCQCEGQEVLLPDKLIYICSKCEHSVCSSCRSRPLHEYKSNDLCRSLKPREFEIRWKPIFPASILLQDLPDFNHLATNINVNEKIWNGYIEAVKETSRHLLTFQGFKRTEYWVVRYESSTAVLELTISQRGGNWRLFAKPPLELPANDQLRTQLQQAVARAALPEDFLSRDDGGWAGKWEWFVPSRHKFHVRIKPENGTNPSWRAEYGLEGYEHEQIPQRLDIDIDTEDAALLDEDISGTYEHLPDCGTACKSLYRRIPSRLGPKPKTIYLLLDPSRVGSVNEDAFAFSYDHERAEDSRLRNVVACLDATWRPWRISCQWDEVSFSTFGFVSGQWVQDSVKATRLHPLSTKLRVSNPTGNPDWNESNYVKDCSEYLAVLQVQFNTREDTHGTTITYRWNDINSRSFFTKFSWILEKSRHIPNLENWRSLQDPSYHCTHCSPSVPVIQWRQEVQTIKRKTKVTVIPQEEPGQASKYERALKTRPSILALQATVNQDGICHLRAGINILALAHRARGHFGRDPQNSVSLSWNLVTEYAPARQLTLPPFRLCDNTEDEEHPQPEGFKIVLKPSQRRSLTWLRSQEMGTRFTLEETEEEIFDSLRWKIEARAQSEIVVRGGVIADQVSYGKTIITLALIHTAFRTNSTPNQSKATLQGLINLKATLIVVPDNITKQWYSQVKNCLHEEEYGLQEILLIQNINELRKKKIVDFQQTRIVLIPFSLLDSDEYLQRLGKLTAMPEHPNGDGRAFSAWFEYAMKKFPDMMNELRELGQKAFEEQLPSHLDQTLGGEAFKGQIPTKRLRGKQYKGYDEHKASSERRSGVGKSAETKTKHFDPVKKKDDWESFSFPVLHQFNFDRLVIDEFTYPKSNNYTTLVRLSADKRWVLSGTPPLDDFADIKRIASFLSINLGVDCDAYGVITRRNAKLMSKEQTTFEKFQTFRQKRSSVWHERRHLHAQRFLDTFARQNLADIKVNCKETLYPIVLRPDHRAKYMELNQHLAARMMRIMQPASQDIGDRVERLKAALKGQSTAEEALLTLASYNPIGISQNSPCIDLIHQRELDLDNTTKEFEKYLLQAETLKRNCAPDEEKYKDWREGKLSGQIGDAKAGSDLRKMIARASQEAMASPTKPLNYGDAKDRLRVLTALKISTMERRFVYHRRALRYARHVKKVDQARETNTTISCESCVDKRSIPAVTATVLVGCGHLVCDHCVLDALDKQKCSVKGCNMSIETSHLLKAKDLGPEDVEPEQASYGEKLDAVLELLHQITDTPTPAEKINDKGHVKEHLNKGGQTIIFVQSYYMMKRAKEALADAGFTFFAIEKKGSRASTDIQKFKTYVFDTDIHYRQVLLLNLEDESASGMDLVNANHIIFLSPLLTDTESKYHSAMTQAIGRARRYGQRNVVKVHRFVALKTVDVDVLEQRERRLGALTESEKDMEQLYQPGLDGQQDYERTRLVEDGDGQMVLVPRSWLSDLRVAAEKGVNLNVEHENDLERFNSLVRFSDTYAEEDVF